MTRKHSRMTRASPLAERLELRAEARHFGFRLLAPLLLVFAPLLLVFALLLLFLAPSLLGGELGFEPLDALLGFVRESRHPVDELVGEGHGGVTDGESEARPVEPEVEAEDGGVKAPALGDASPVADPLELPGGEGHVPAIEQVVL